MWNHAIVCSVADKILHNVALKKPSSQISTYGGHNASFANDGDLHHYNYVQSNSEPNPWWMVDLGNDTYTYIHQVNFTNTGNFHGNPFDCGTSLNIDSLHVVNVSGAMLRHKTQLSWCWQTRATLLEVSEALQTWYHSICYVWGFLLVCCSNLSLCFSDILLQKMRWPLNPGQRSFKVIESGTIR